MIFKYNENFTENINLINVNNELEIKIEDQDQHIKHLEILINN